MAKKTSKKAAPKVAPSVDAPVAGEIAASTPARKTVKPRATKSAAVAAPMPVTHERIAERAYYISLTGRGGSETDNWHLAEDELRREGGAV